MRPVSYINQRRTISTAAVPPHVRSGSARRHPSAWPIGARSRAAQDADARLEREQEIATVKGLMARSGSTRPPLLGAPTRCPDCNEWGMVQASQPGGHLHACRACGAEWVITARALLAVQADLDAAGRFADAATAPALPAAANRRAATAAEDRVIDLVSARRFRAWNTGAAGVLGT